MVLVQVLWFPLHTLLSICLTPDGKHVVSGSRKGYIRVLRIKDSALVREIKGRHIGDVSNVCVTPDSKHVVTVCMMCTQKYAYTRDSIIHIICIKNVFLCRQWSRILLRDQLPITNPVKNSSTSNQSDYLQQLLMYFHMYPGLVKFVGTKLMLFAAYV